MAQVVLSISFTSSKKINQIFTPGKTWVNFAGLVYDVEEP